MAGQMRQEEAARQEMTAFVAGLPRRSPQEIYDLIRARGYIGQEEALKAAALWAYRHVSRLEKIHVRGVPRGQLPSKSNMLFVGPTGCGKTFLVELLFREALRLPTVLVDVTGYSETGYVGQDVGTILTRLLYAADLNPVLTSIGVVCLDEFDKLASGQNNAVFAGAGTTKDVSGLGVQRELLKMLESAQVPVPVELTHSEYAPKALISTEDVLFVAAGAFSGLKGLIEGGGGGIGFAREPAGDSRGRIAVSYSAAELQFVRNFQSYGFLPELIGRFQRIVPFRALQREELTEILRRRVLRQYQEEFRLDGIELEVEAEVLEAIVSRSLRMETGARGIDAAFIQHLEEAAFGAYSRPGAQRVRLYARGGEVGFELA